MTFFDDLLNNKQYTISALADLVRREGERVCAAGLATQDDVHKLLQSAVERKSDLATLHETLAAVKLPGDFEVVAADWYKVPEGFGEYEGEKFYDLSSLKRDKGEEETDEAVEELQEALEEYVESEQESDADHAEDCACDSCDDAAIDAQMALALAINKHLMKIAHALGAKGDHENAYKVERTARSIKFSASNGKLLKLKKRGHK